METTMHTVLALDPQQIAGCPWTPVTGCEGVLVKELWRRGDLVDALLRYEPGAGTPGAPHSVDQHLWVVAGEVTVDGRHLPAGSYIHVPAGTPHPLRATGSMGCVLLQSHTHLPVAVAGSFSAATCQY